MKITEFADIIMADLNIKRYNNQKERWTASFEHCEIKIDGCLSSTYGDGSSAAEAINNYAEKISGKLLVLNAWNKEKRQEFFAPALEL